ncbi:MAG: hypothetical protein AUJ47_07315 [Candidatus Marinimicrobia bacterium CG1_02_48_14]|nr:MAG: hypothetical protein AUJ47_07315 [Candidatus Marinimicrobia bacterium CG1_02_48_14]
MKHLSMTLALMLTLSIGSTNAQLLTESWAMGVGLTYPRYYGVNVTAINSNYGGYFLLQRNFSERIGMRFKGSFSHMEGQWTDGSANLITEETELMTTNIDMLYYPAPCAPVSPYLFFGGGANYRKLVNFQTTTLDPSAYGTQLGLGVGAQYSINTNWSFVTEFGYHVTNNSQLDGSVSPAELNGRDSYMVLSAGINFIFGKGDESTICEDQDNYVVPARKDMTDYKRIEQLIIKHIPQVISTDVVVERYIMQFEDDILVLVGVNFAFDKAELLPESYPVLDKSVVLLKETPGAKFEVEGYTDYIGTKAYNMELSIQRAQVVKDYLVSKGIHQDRLTTVGYGKLHPIGDNETESGRAMNRRIVFKIIK